MIGYIIDGWDLNQEITLWIKTENNNNLFVKDNYYQNIFVRCHTQKGKSILFELVKNNILTYPEETRKVLLWSGNSIPVYSHLVLNYHLFKIQLKQYLNIKKHIEFFNTDILPIHGYFMYKNIYPLAKVKLDLDGENVKYIHLLSNQKNLLREPVLFTSIFIKSKKGTVVPLGKNNPLILQISKKDELEITGNEKEILLTLNKLISQIDPDIIFSNKGDEFILPNLFKWSSSNKIPLELDRVNQKIIRKIEIKKKSFFTYGRIIYKTTPFPLFGRLHIDKSQSFFYTEADLEGIFEMSILSRIPIQKLARGSPGSAMSAMEDETAINNNILIPIVKGKAGSIKSLQSIIKSDQGGLTFKPNPGVFIDVIELDFRSLYPNIMYHFNISGETINCDCCKEEGSKVPFINYWVCKKRRGIVGDTIKILLDRRDAFKNYLSKNDITSNERYALELKASAIKWCLVTSFGYTGYKHAKYGQREAHEAITAFGRDVILKAKEIAENYGYNLLHCLTDSLWLYGGDTKKEFILTLCELINKATKLTILHESTYSWIVFPKSNIHKNNATSTRYYGRIMNGEIKVRGLLSRRHDTPKLINNFQSEIFACLSNFKNLSQVKENLHQIHSIKNKYLKMILNGNLEMDQLKIKLIVSKGVDEYKSNNASRIILEYIKNDGVEFIGGQTIEYIVLNTMSSNIMNRYIPIYRYNKTMGYDKKYYYKKILDAYNEIMEYFDPKENLLFK